MGPGTANPPTPGEVSGGAPVSGGIAENGVPCGSSSGPSPIIIEPPAPTIGTPPPQLLQHSQGQQPRARNMLIREKPPPQPPQGLAHPADSKTPNSVAEVANRNQLMCAPLVAIIPERE